MYLDKFIDKNVIVNVQREFVQANPGFFQHRGSAKLFYMRLRAVDELGLWVENRDWKTTPVGGKEEEHRLVFQIPFGAVLSVGAFPDRKFTDDRQEEDSSDQKIGFLVGADDAPKK
jgi:hypothetical protein